MDFLELDKQIRRFLHEDIGQGDITTDPVFTTGQECSAILVSRETLVAAGMDKVAARVFHILNSEIKTSAAVTDGTQVEAGTELLHLQGPVRDILRGERVALNLVQRICGIATLTRKYINQVAGLDVQITDTRKTTPGLRMIEKYAVRCGGGKNHRFNLADGVLVKDNHIAACGSITEAVRKIRESVPHTFRIEVEADNLNQVDECLSCNVDIIMLDNMTLSQMREAVKRIDKRAIIEASGGVNLETVRGIAETGVDIISVGRLTHSASACDISMEF